jgi:hypothetical protein
MHWCAQRTLQLYLDDLLERGARSCQTGSPENRSPAVLRWDAEPLLIAWDKLGAHKSRKSRQWLAAQYARIPLAFLPAYALERKSKRQ